MPKVTHPEDPSIGISLSLKKSTLERIRNIAKSNDRSLSWIVDHAVMDWITRNTKPVTTTTTAP